jgi:pyruvate dehydrogenase E2 component (dihydrolipoamide acetyltransferase)
MPTEVVMPKLGLNMSEGLIAEWLKQEGDSVNQGDILFVVETDKITTESEAQTDGILAKILVKEGEVVPVATPVAIIVAVGEALPDNDTVAPSAKSRPSAAPQEAIPVFEETVSDTADVVLASPAAKRLAWDRGLDLSSIPGTGRYGSVKRADVEQYIGKQEQAAPAKLLASPVAKRLAKAHGINLASVEGTNRGGRITQDDVQRVIDMGQKDEHPIPDEDSIPIEGVRATIAGRMSSSQQQTAQVTLFTEVDATNLVNLRQAYKRVASSADSKVPSYNTLLIIIVAQALGEHPRMNARQEGEVIRLLNDINVGLAMDTERGLLVLVVKDVDQKSVHDIESELADLAQRASLGKSRLDDLTGGTFTITNLGAFGIDSFTPIINPPEIGILGVGRIIEKPVMIEGEVHGQPMITLSLTFDHRLIDGAPAARFLQRIAQLIETV